MSQSHSLLFPSDRHLGISRSGHIHLSTIQICSKIPSVRGWTSPNCKRPGLVQSSRRGFWTDRISPQFCWTRIVLDWTGVCHSSAVSRVRVYFSITQSFNERNICWFYQTYRPNYHICAQSEYSLMSGYQMSGWVMVSVIPDYKKILHL